MPSKTTTPAAPAVVAPAAVAPGAEAATGAEDAASATATPAAEPEDLNTRIAHQVLEDFIVSTLLSRGRALKSTDFSAAASGFSVTRAGLRESLHHFRRIAPSEREWDLTLRLHSKALSREEKARRPLESTLRELLDAFGKPLPLPVIVRELALLRSVYPETVRDAAGNVLHAARWAIEVRAGTFLSQTFLLDAGAPTEALIIRENRLEDDPDFAELHSAELHNDAALRDTPAANRESTLETRAAQVLQLANRPLRQKTLGFLLWQQNPERFDARELARALGNKDVFYSLLDGAVTLQAQMPQWRGVLGRWMHGLSGAAADALDVAALLRRRMAPEGIIAPRPEEIEDVKNFARGTDGHPFSLATALTDVLEMEPDDPHFTGTLQGLNDALRRNPEFLSAGIGRYLLRESVPPHVGEIPEALRPIHLSVRDTETDEPLDVEMSDDGLEGDAPEFIHAPQWEDVNEEVEVKLPRRSATDVATSTRYVILNHHHRAGTIKLRRMDEDFFAVDGALARIPMRAVDDGGATDIGATDIGAWASRDSGLIYGLGEWFAERTPPSGGVLLFTRDENGGEQIQVSLQEPDKLTHIDANRAEELEALRESANYLALFDLLQTIMSGHQQGAELPALWAEVNVVRRTSKRLLCSVLSAYHCFYFKQRGPKQILWRFDASRTDQGFKRNKRKYVRR